MGRVKQRLSEKGHEMTQLTLVEEFVSSGMGWNRKKQSVSVNSRKSYKNHLKQFEVFLEKCGKTVADVKDEDIQAYIDDMVQRGFQPNTVAVKIAALSSYFKWMKHKGAITHHPEIKSQPHYPGIHKKIPDDVLDALFSKINGDSFKEIRDTAMISLIAFGGFKTEQVVALNVSDVSWTDQTIKGEPMTGIADALNRYALKRQAASPDDPFFINKHQQRISARSLRRHLCKYLDALGLDETYSTRDLQHTYRCRQQVQAV